MNRLNAFQLFEIEVADAGIADFALRYQFAERAPAFLNVFGRNGPMELIEIDAIDVQPPQARIAFSADAVTLETAGDAVVGLRNTAALCGDEWFHFQFRERLRDDFFGMSVAVDRRRVDPVDAQFNRAMDRADRVLVV